MSRSYERGWQVYRMCFARCGKNVESAFSGRKYSVFSLRNKKENCAALQVVVRYNYAIWRFLCIMGVPLELL